MEEILTPDDDFFWLQRAGIITSDTAEKLDGGARRLADAMAWFWTAYSAVVLVAVATTDIAGNVVVASVLALPIVVIFAAYMLATFATLPVRLEFDVREPAAIKSAHDSAIYRKQCRLRTSTVLACIASVLVAIAVVTASLSQSRSTKEGVTVTTNADQSTAHVTGHLANIDSVIIRVDGSDKTSTERAVALVAGNFDAAVPLEQPGTYRITTSWRNGSRQFNISESVEKK